MRHGPNVARNEAFSGDLTSYMKEARSMYPGGRFQRFVRAFDRVFHRGVVEIIDIHNAMVVADHEYRAAVDQERAMALGRQMLPYDAGQRTMRETCLGDLYDQIDKGEQVAPGLLALYEGLVQEERV